MREILFKAKRIDNGEWVQGSLIIYQNGECSICAQGFISDGLLEYEVDPATLCQYTGLTDKNGVKIFEGDAVKITLLMSRSGGKPISEISSVVFENGRFGMHRGNDWHLTSFDAFCDTEFEVIGSIHDTPKKED